LAEVRKGLEKRRKERESQQNCFESWFKQSPWLTTLLSAIAGPLLLILLTLTFGPCILNKFMDFVKSRIDTIQLMMLRQQYIVLNKESDNQSELELENIQN
ncbi:ENV1 protein, partial [Alectura lathami]|nr:ENV1 protein [Alectura lathami]